MRITGGSARGILLDVPPKGEVRPATDFTRERIFNCIVPTIQEAVVLDCFAGTGAYGLEALSRYAKMCIYLEQDPHVIPTLRSNCEKVCKSAQRNLQTAVKIINTDVFKFNVQLVDHIDYLFFDPPYRFWEEDKEQIFSFFERIGEKFPQITLALEYPSQFSWPPNIPWQPLYPIKPSKKKNAPAINLFKRVG